MKKLVVIMSLFFAFFQANAQVKTPQASPTSKLMQTVGLTNIDIEYSRPAAKGRTVYGDLVPYGKVWRTGANNNTIISFSDNVTFSGKELKKGTYALFTIPKADSWDVIFYSETNNWGTPENWDDNKVALKVNVKPETLNKAVETFTIAVSNLSIDGANLDISWERTLISIPFMVPTKENTMKSIDAAMAGPKQGDYFSSAQYYYQSGNDMNKALTWVNKSLELSTATENPNPFYYLRLKSLIQAKLGDKKGAIATAKQSLEGAQKAKNGDYEKMNKDSIAEWSK